jgi:hypothetical protein
VRGAAPVGAALFLALAEHRFVRPASCVMPRFVRWLLRHTAPERRLTRVLACLLHLLEVLLRPLADGLEQGL